MTTDEMIQELIRERSNEYGGMTLATFDSLIAKLRAADELAKAADRVASMNVMDLRDSKILMNVYFSLEAYRAAGKGNE